MMLVYIQNQEMSAPDKETVSGIGLIVTICQ